MDLLLKSDSESDVDDDVLEVTKSSDYKERPAYRNKQLTKMFAIREILKWKYNYFESNAHEHPIFYKFGNYKKSYRSFAFKKLWRMRMDKEFNTETLKMHRVYLERQLKKLNQSQGSNSSLSSMDPTRLLVNYDREVVTMIRQVRDKFNSYLQLPDRYPLYEAEKKNFLIDQCLAAAENVTQITMDDIDKKFSIYWENRMAVLCDLEISRLKKLMRRDWKQLMPVYHDLGEEKSCSELQELLLSDNDNETDEN